MWLAPDSLPIPELGIVQRSFDFGHGAIALEFIRRREPAFQLYQCHRLGLQRLPNPTLERVQHLITQLTIGVLQILLFVLLLESYRQLERAWALVPIDGDG